MAYQSTWYFTDLPEKVVDLIEEDLTEKFDPQMADSRLHGDALNKEKRNSQNAWIPTTHWVGGTTPADGGGSGVDTYAFNILKTANQTYTVVANQSKTS